MAITPSIRELYKLIASASLTESARAASLLYVTCGSREEATAIARTAVEERLAACGNILGAMRSIYWWQGSVNEDDEFVLILKTTAENVDKLTERVKELHSYDLPCVVEIPLGGGNAAYFDWIAAETSDA